VYRDILSAQIRPNAAKLIQGRRFTDPMSTWTMTQNILQIQPSSFWRKICEILWMAESPDLNPIEYAFHLLKAKLKEERPTNKKLKTARVKARQSITKEETKSLVISMGSRPGFELGMCTISAHQLNSIDAISRH